MTLPTSQPSARETDPLEARCVVDTRAEPIALAVTPDDATVLVTSGWAHTVAAFDDGAKEVRSAAAGRSTTGEMAGLAPRHLPCPAFPPSFFGPFCTLSGIVIARVVFPLASYCCLA